MAANAQIWWRRAEQARRLALSLPPDDAAILHRYAQECEYHGRCLSDPLGHRRCGGCPLVNGETE
jgi:hypothetical protein